MKIMTKIKAFFRWRNENAELEVSAAEVRQGKVFLHPADDEEHVYCMKADMVDIIINPHKEIREEDVQILKRKKAAVESETQTKEKKRESDNAGKRRERNEGYQKTGMGIYTPKTTSQIQFTSVI